MIFRKRKNLETPKALLDEKASIQNILKKVKRVEMHSRRLVSEAMVGAYHSVFKGQGIDFEEVREYTPGDDVRSIDWNVTAKMGRPFVKKFREERERTLVLAIDLSASGNFSSAQESKRERAAEVASILALSAEKNNDKVGLFLFTDRVEKVIPPGKTRRHLLRLIREILFYQPDHKGTNIPDALDTLNRTLKKGAIVFLFSDFITSPPTPETLYYQDSIDPALIKALTLTQKKHELICIGLSDPRERELPSIGLIRLKDAETDRLCVIDTNSKEVRHTYKKHNEQRRQSLQNVFCSKGISFLEIMTDKPYFEALKKFFSRVKKDSVGNLLLFNYLNSTSANIVNGIATISLLLRLTIKVIEQIFLGMKIIAYMKPHCGYSRGIRAILEKYSLEYEEKDIAGNPIFLEEMIKKTNQEMSPCIEINGIILAGISGEELENYLLSNNLVTPNEKPVEVPINGCGCGRKQKPHNQVSYSMPEISSETVRFF